MKIGKVKKSEKVEDIEMKDVPKITIKSKTIKKDSKCRKSKRQVAF
jgi:hypothetical protein